jgi:hypothetical protein
MQFNQNFKKFVEPKLRGKRPCRRSAPPHLSRTQRARWDYAQTWYKIKILIEEKCKKLDSDQIEGADFEFLGLEDRFEKNKRSKFWNVEIEILKPKSKFRLGHASSRAQKSTLLDF